jgi:membrane dipeptidase
LKALAAKGGAMCISTIFMSEMNMSPARAKLFGAYERIGKMSPDRASRSHAPVARTRQDRD